MVGNIKPTSLSGHTPPTIVDTISEEKARTSAKTEEAASIKGKSSHSGSNVLWMTGANIKEKAKNTLDAVGKKFSSFVATVTNTLKQAGEGIRSLVSSPHSKGELSAPSDEINAGSNTSARAVSTMPNSDIQENKKSILQRIAQKFSSFFNALINAPKKAKQEIDSLLSIRSVPEEATPSIDDLR